MRLTTIGLMIALCIYASKSVNAGEIAEDKEPGQIFYIDSGGKVTTVELDKPFKLDSLGGAESAVLRVEPFRIFKYGGISFRYPREFTFEADLSTKESPSWTLSGNVCKIMIHHYKNDTDIDLAVMVAAVKDRLTLKETKDSPITLKLKNATLTGTRVEMNLRGTLIRQDHYFFINGGDSIGLMLLDCPQENGQPSADSVRAEKMLLETLRLPGK